MKIKLLPRCIISLMPCGGLYVHSICRIKKQKKHKTLLTLTLLLSPGEALSFSRQEHLLRHALSFSPSASTLLILSFRKQPFLSRSPSPSPLLSPSLVLLFLLPFSPLLFLNLSFPLSSLLTNAGKITCSRSSPCLKT